ncbi:MAG: 4Fe-4S dicluster domain-containing protein [Candidatus Comchoanobacterales bacterium]
MDEQTLTCDVLIVGAGPAGLSCAIALKKRQPDCHVMIIEKGAELGAHILSGNVFDAHYLNELLGDDHHAPLDTPVVKDHFWWLGKQSYWSLPVPPTLNNKGNYIISLSSLVRWMGSYAEQLGVDIYPGFSGASLVVKQQRVVGITTGEMGCLKNGQPGPGYQAGVSILANHVVLAEGAKGSLSSEVIERFNLRTSCQPQTYGLGMKELWRLPKEQHQPGHVIHTMGWPMDQKTYGGGFAYHWGDDWLSLGFIVGLDYENPWLDPFKEYQKFKTHPEISKLITNGTVQGYGARVINEGGYQAVPKLTFPGGCLVGCAAGFVNIAQIKGSHHAIRTGHLAAKAILNNEDYDAMVREDDVMKSLKKARNIRPGFYGGLWKGLLNAGFVSYLTRGYEPWTLGLREDHLQTKPKDTMPKIQYPKPDGRYTFDRLTVLRWSNTNHTEGQPSHLVILDPSKPISLNYDQYGSPETRYCPANVYEILVLNGEKKLHINAQNCLHCKACAIKDPSLNIQWRVPEGGGGPRYQSM